MAFDEEPTIYQQSPSALERARFMSQALADVARLARVSKRDRRALTSGGFQARRGAKTMRVAVWMSFVAMVVIPSLSAAVYYSFFASDQYVAEAKFTVFGGLPPAADTFGKLTGIPAMAIIQDTQIVTNYIHSRAAVEKLEDTINLRALYSTPRADRWARFDPKRSIEKLVRYWDRMSQVSIGMPAGIVDLKVRAFTPGDAVKITSAVLKISEELINNLNDRMRHDEITNAEAELARTSERLTNARLALEAARNSTGLLDAEKTSDSLMKLITGVRSNLLQLQEQYTSGLNYVSEKAPQMRALQSRIAATKDQIAELESKLTETKLSSPSDPTLASSMTKFSELDLERQIAERLYAGAAAALEIARIGAEHKMMYLNTFETPAAPQEAQYPRRILYSIAILLAALGIWGSCCGLVMAVRNYMA